MQKGACSNAKLLPLSCEVAAVISQGEGFCSHWGSKWLYCMFSIVLIAMVTPRSSEGFYSWRLMATMRCMKEALPRLGCSVCVCEWMYVYVWWVYVHAEKQYKEVYILLATYIHWHCLSCTHVLHSGARLWQAEVLQRGGYLLDSCHNHIRTLLTTVRIQVQGAPALTNKVWGDRNFISLALQCGHLAHWQYLSPG